MTFETVALKQNLCKILKILFIIGLLVRFAAPWNQISQLNVAEGGVPAPAIGAQPVSVPLERGDGGSQYSVKPFV